MFGVLDRYIGRNILTSIMMTLFLLTSLSGVIKFVEQLRKVGASYSLLDAGVFTLFTMPKDIQLFFPMAALLGALIGLGGLASRSELVVMQAAGFSKLQIALSVMKTAIPLVLVTMVIGEWIAPVSEQAGQNYRVQKLYGKSLLATQNGVWAKDQNDYIFIRRVTGGTKLNGVNIYHFDDQRRLTSMQYAAQGEYKEGVWKLHQVETSDLTDDKRVVGTSVLSMDWKTNLTPDKLGIVTLSFESLSMSGLYDYVKYLKHTGQEYSRYELKLWSKLLAPFSVAVMMLMALSFIFGPLRSVPMGARIVTGISFGFLFYVLDQVFGPLSLVYSVPAIVGAMLPSLLFLTISLYLLLKRN